MSAALVTLPVLEKRARARRSVGKTRALADTHGRVIRDLRISVTDRCNMRCVYCMDPGTRFMPRDEVLTGDELVRVVSVFSSLGVRRVRITGGEPALRADLTEIIRGIAATQADDIAMTTNGSIAKSGHLSSWRRAGLRRITFSLDAAEQSVFERLTRSTERAGDIIKSIRHATTLGFERVKLNTVVIKGHNESQVVPLAALARELGIDVRFIEFMPLDGGRRWSSEHVYRAAQIRDDVAGAFPLTVGEREHRSATAEVYRFADGAPGSIGLVAPVTRNFCGACDRVRVAADGTIRPCLFGPSTGSMRELLRTGASDDELRGEIVAAVEGKQAGHGIGSESFSRTDVAMNTLGG